jgi:hypothetical protein
MIELTDGIRRDVDAIPCPCGGYADRVDVSQEESAKYGCKNYVDCCSRAFVCRICKERLVGKADAPEAD